MESPPSMWFTIALPAAVSVITALVTLFLSELLIKPWLEWRKDLRKAAMSARRDLYDVAFRLQLQAQMVAVHAKSALDWVEQTGEVPGFDPEDRNFREMAEQAEELAGLRKPAEPIAPDVIRRTLNLCLYESDQARRHAQNRCWEDARDSAEFVVGATQWVRSWSRAWPPLRWYVRLRARRLLNAASERLDRLDDD